MSGALPRGARLLKESIRGRGNVLLLYGEGDAARVLKLYRPRYGFAGERLSSLAHRWLERKRGVSPAERCRTERDSLELWRAHGFDVFRVLDAPLPDDVAPPALWLEHCPGTTLARRLREPSITAAEKAALLRRFGADLGRRQRLALERDEPLLVQEHGTLKHLLLSGDRLIAFDFEGGFRPGFPVLEALAQELGSLSRSTIKYAGDDATVALAALVEGHGDRALLARIARYGIEGGGLYRRVRRWYDRRQREDGAKTSGLEAMLRVLGG